MINTQIHRQILLNLLLSIYKTAPLPNQLAFKGGTCLYFLHQLPRFSTDLDFNLLVDPKDFDINTLTAIIKKNLTIKDQHEKHNTWFFKTVYGDGKQNIKIEISKRKFPDTYTPQNLYGLTINCLDLPCQFAHKLCAITDRKTLANRDLFDAHFLFQKNTAIDGNIIEHRTGLNIQEYFKKLANYIPKHVSKRGVLEKAWAKQNLVEELLFYLESY